MSPTGAFLLPSVKKKDFLGSTYPGVCDFELPQDVLRHVVFCHGVHNKVLVACRALSRPVLMALLLESRKNKMCSRGPKVNHHYYMHLEIMLRAQRQRSGISRICTFQTPVLVIRNNIKCESGLTRPISRTLVSMTTMVELCSHSILQKSSVVSASGPWVAMYALCCLQITTHTSAFCLS